MDVATASGAVRAFFLGLLLDDLAGAFLVGVEAFAASARFSAQRLLVASLIAFLPAALSFRFCLAGLGATSDDAGSASPLILAHLAFCAAAILRRPAALIFLLRAEVPDSAPGSALPPFSSWRSSSIWESIRRFRDSKPSMAAWMISAVSFWVGM